MGLSEKHIAPLLLGGIIAAGASLAGNAIGSASQSKVNDTNLQINRENNAFNAAEAEKQRNWQESMWNKNNEYNSPSAMISRGLNPYIGWADVFQNQAVNTGSAAPIGEMGGVLVS